MMGWFTNQSWRPILGNLSPRSSRKMVPCGRALLVMLLVFVSSVCVSMAVEDIIISPIEGKTGKAKLLFFVPGGKVPNEHYRSTAVAIQEASSNQMWVVIPTCHFNLCTPTPGLTSSLESGQKVANLTDIDTFVGGHSLGGVVARAFIDMHHNKRKFQGSFLFGTNYPGQLNKPSLPQLEVGGEIDGVTVANMAPEYERFFKAAEKDLSVALRSLDASPVFVLKDVDHSDFCPGFFVPGDIRSLTTPDEAAAKIGGITGAWLDLVINPEDEDTLQVLSEGMKVTEELMRPSVTLRALDDQAWCAHAQRILSGLPQDQFQAQVEVEVVQEGTPTSTLLPSGKLRITVVASAYYPGGESPFTTETVAHDLTCGCLAASKVQALLGMTAPPAGGESVTSCEEVNKAAISTAGAIAPPRVKARYSSAPQLMTGGDVNGWGLLHPHLVESFTATGDKIVSSPSLVGGDGTHMCKLLSPEKALAWMMTDSQRTPKK